MHTQQQSCDLPVNPFLMKSEYFQEVTHLSNVAFSANTADEFVLKLPFDVNNKRYGKCFSETYLLCHPNCA